MPGGASLDHRAQPVRLGVAPRRRVTIKDVAAATGLSPAAVSYALRGVQTSPETQERVRQAADELGYTGNAVARALARGSTGLVGVLSGSLQDLSEQRFVEALGRELGRRDLHMVVVDARGEPERERMLARQLADQLVDGLIVSPLDPSDAAWQDIGEMLPIVTVGDALAGPTVGEVLFDNRAGVSMVLEHLHGLGHRRIAVLTPSRPSTPDRPAERVVAEVCEALGLEATVVNSPHSIEEATADGGRAARARAAPDRGLLPLGLDRVRRLRGGGRAGPRDPARPLGRRLRRPPDRRPSCRRRSPTSSGGCRTWRRPRRRCSPRRWRGGRSRGRALGCGCLRCWWSARAPRLLRWLLP